LFVNLLTFLVLNTVSPASADYLKPIAAVVLAELVLINFLSNWNFIGRAAFAVLVMAVASFLAYAAYATFFSHLGPLSLAFSIFLLSFEFAALILMVSHAFEILDVLCRVIWRRIPAVKPAYDYFPKVSLHVPAYNEPPELVIETLNALARLDYPNYEVIMVDDNTTDERLWRPVEAHCQKLGFKFYHLENWPGFKSGALNFALTKTDPEAEIVGVVDSDYVVEPNYLSDLVGLFADSQIAFVQTPQDYRDFSGPDVYLNACYRAYQYFFKISMASRNERNTVIFCGTMGLIRRAALEAAGGWDEWCITEDAEVSLRLLNQGYLSYYVDRTYGRGLMPLNFEGLKKQRFRWAFGGVQILKKHWSKLLPWSGRLDPENKMTSAQKIDYFFGALHWFNDPFNFVFTVILLISAASLATTNSLFIHPMVGATVFMPLAFLLFGLFRGWWALRVRLGCRWKEARQAFRVFLGLTWVVTLACFLALVKKEGVFLRTPKKREKTKFMETLRPVRAEAFILGVVALGFLSLLTTEPLTGAKFFLAGLLMWQGFIYSSSVVCSLWSYASEQLAQNPVYFLSSRTTGERFSSMTGVHKPTWMILSVAVALLLFFFAAVRFSPELELVFRTDPEKQFLRSDPFIETPPEALLKANIYREEQYVLNRKLSAILSLYDEDAVLRDANYTAQDTSDDRVWVGLEQIRQRYEREFAERRYFVLRHQNVSSVIEGDRATMVNDLRAVLRTEEGIQRVFLSKGDRWVFKRKNGEWKIASFTYNLTPR
jgi:cellulose synthase/poly-beta-1,6-N-acetylglucosamine synthase-like glycosyltransferase